MRTVAILGASSQIARDLIESWAAAENTRMQLYVRDEPATQEWVNARDLGGICSVHHYRAYGELDHDAVINFIGVGDPKKAAEMGSSIFAITQEYDDLVIAGLREHPDRRYVFLSSGAAYGSAFLEPATQQTVATIAINDLSPQEYYPVAKLHAESKHRAFGDLAITDIRVFNYFSRTIDLATRFFITDAVRAIRDDETLVTSPAFIVRDYIHPSDFRQLVDRILDAPRQNQVLDCYSRAPIEKPELLAELAQRFGLRYRVDESTAVVNATGLKPHYYSTNRRAAGVGYEPEYSSVEGIAVEIDAILGEPATAL